MLIDEIDIRSFAITDQAQVEELWTIVFPNDPPHNKPSLMIQSKLTVQPELFFVAVHAEKIVGTVLAGFDGVRGWIHHLAVLPEYRKNRIGEKLMRTAIEELKKIGCPKVNLQVRTTNLGVIEFYKSIGFKQDDVISLGLKL
jgi:ribosomal protein S18 acetylase RimI-like enzyme